MQRSSGVSALPLVVLWALSAWRLAALDAALFEEVLATPAAWRTPDFTRLWVREPLDAGAAVSRGGLSQGVEVFGMQPASVTARFLTDNQVHSVSVVMLDAGAFFGFGNSNLATGETFEMAKARFDKEFVLRKQNLVTGLQKLGAQSSGEVNLGGRSGLKLKAQLWKGGTLSARVFSYEHQLLQVDFHRTEAEARSLVATATAPDKAKPSALQAMTPRGGPPERRVTGIPMIPQGNRGYCGVAILAMMGAHFGLTTGAEELAAANGFLYGQDTNPDIREMFSQVAKEAGVKAQRSPKLDIPTLKRSVDAGMPVVVFRRWAQERDYLHSVYARQIALGEKAELPSPGMEDRKSWPGKDAPAHASIINGYRDDRREVIFTESWGQQARNRRMRYEEMEGTSYYAVYFSR